MRNRLVHPFLFLTAAAPSAFALNAGDLAFTALNADEDGWAMVALAGIPANTTVYFTDNEWDGVSAFNGGESHHRWESGGTAIPAGTVIRFSAVDNATSLAASSGTLARETVSGSTNYGLSGGEESVYAYLGSSATTPTTFLAAICNKSFGTTAAGSLANTGLTLGSGAIQTGNANGSDLAQYTGPRAGQASFAAYLPLVSDLARWTDGGDGDYAATVPDTTAFSAGPTSIDLSTYVRVGRHDLPEPTRTTSPDPENFLCQEASGVTYNWDTDTLFLVGDGGRSVTQVSKTGALIDTMTLPLGTSAHGTVFYDTEGIAYLGNGEFVMTEERDRQLVKFTYAAGTTLTREMTQTVKLGTFVDNVGLEGLTDDPLTGGFICFKEMSPLGIFQTGIDFAAGTATNGSPTTGNSTDLFDPALLGMTDVADGFALANLPSMAGQPQQENLLVISQEDGKVVNISRSGVIASTLVIASDAGNPLTVGGQQHEGVTMDRAGNLYLVNENGGGDINHPQLWVYAPTAAANQPPTAVAVNNAVPSVLENTSTASRLPLGDLVITDDGLGTHQLSLTGADAAFFELVGTGLYLKAGTVLDFETKGSYSVTIGADDTSVGATPDVAVNFTLTVTDDPVETPPAPVLIISEVSPWSSTATSSPVAADWFEVTNISDSPVDLSGWKVDDSSASFGSAVALNGIATIAPGESVIFIETNDLAAKSALFLGNWFGETPPAGLQIGSYTGSGIGLSASGDGLNLYNAAGARQTGLTFGASPDAAPFATFDNTAGLYDTAISRLSVAGTHGAFAAANSPGETGSPGYSAPGVPRITEVAPWGSGNSPALADWFEVTNVGGRAVDITGWKVDDSSESPAAALALNGITSIAAGESVVFLESATPATTIPTFVSTWFGSNPPAGLQVGSYTGTGIGLSTGGDAVNLYDTANVRVANVSFGAAPFAAPFATFDNAAGVNVGALAQLSAIGSNGAFAAVTDPAEIGSPGSVSNPAHFTPFTAWLAGNGYSSGGIDQDSDGDGLTDRVEFFFNQNPNDPSDLAHLPRVTPDGGDLSFSFTRRTSTPGTGGRLAVSGNLLDWTPALEGIDYLAASEVANGDETTVTLDLPGTGPSAPGTSATYLAPNPSDPAGATLGGVRVVNGGLVGVGRLSGESLDKFGETQGAASGLFITGWAYSLGQFSGKFQVLPDRGYGDGASNYAARLHEVDFTFTPYDGSAATAQGQVQLTYADSTKFTYQDGATVKFTTGLNPTGTSSLLGQTVGTVTAANGPGGAQESLLSFDAEAIHLFADGSGFVSDEYGTYIARFDAAKRITGITQLPGAARPHKAGVPDFDSLAAPNSGRRNNQGLEGMSVTPDGSRLFALLQSATVQDTNGTQQQTRNHARLFVYDIAGANRETPVLTGEYVVRLPQLDLDGDGSGLDGTAAQSEIVALGQHSFLMLPRDGNGMGKGTTLPIVFKSVQLVDFASATNILGQFDGVGDAVSPGGVLADGVNAAAAAEIVNLLEPDDLAKFGLNADTNPANANTLNEKIEAMALAPDLSTGADNDFFLFVANDNDFQSSDVKMLNAAGVLESRGDGRLNAGITNDAMFYVWRLTIDAGGNKFFRMEVEEAP